MYFVDIAVVLFLFTLLPLLLVATSAFFIESDKRKAPVREIIFLIAFSIKDASVDHDLSLIQILLI